ncbi:UDP-4-amino-4,6-dideoxy-N-acetyl-beta-L-altrosamine transaminase [Variovorax sp.]|jgi:UDP-4-amino-4,6-dideoxy-N-acetyl-beta-L-altrosamine transaminase|uniref:UDP-4-amino-4, 6-dideoxy-N-acetyl-beta-L-altrosamine transaminase n=1 Tax=Variovorax sp. TaxID=1871043 RepID=UPI0037DA2C1E
MTIPYGRQDIREEDIAAVIRVLQSDFLTQGPVVPAFEEAVAKKVGAGYAVAANSATSALHIACLALGLGPGDSLWTSPITFVASANCALYCGAAVDFVDIDPRTYNMCPLALAEKLKKSANEGRLPKVIVPVHLTGQPCDMEAISKLASEYGVRIIEDASHAIGGAYKNLPIGSCRYSDITIFSFHPVKIITTAEGGMALTNDRHLAERMDLLRSHGITRDPKKMSQVPDGPWYYQQIDLGFNYRLTELQAALGLSQLERLEKYVTARQQQAAVYNSALNSLPLRTPFQHPDSYSAFHLYVIQLEDKERHKAVFESLRKAEIGVNLHYIPVHLQPWYKSMGFRSGDYPASEDYYSRAISLPIFPELQESQQTLVIHSLGEAISQ